MRIQEPVEKDIFQIPTAVDYGQDDHVFPVCAVYHPPRGNDEFPIGGNAMNLQLRTMRPRSGIDVRADADVRIV